jgi:hypothetical protein
MDCFLDAVDNPWQTAWVKVGNLYGPRGPDTDLGFVFLPLMEAAYPLNKDQKGFSFRKETLNNVCEGVTSIRIAVGFTWNAFTSY